MMSQPRNSLPDPYFEALCARDADPWRFATSPYERDKYAATLAALGPGKAVSALEVGCSIGVFTHALASRCGRLLAIDAAENALTQARIRCQGLDGVELRKMRVPAAWPDGRFDLIILSEVLYYLSMLPKSAQSISKPLLVHHGA